MDAGGDAGSGRDVDGVDGLEKGLGMEGGMVFTPNPLHDPSATAAVALAHNKGDVASQMMTRMSSVLRLATRTSLTKRSARGKVSSEPCHHSALSEERAGDAESSKSVSASTGGPDSRVSRCCAESGDDGEGVALSDVHGDGLMMVAADTASATALDMAPEMSPGTNIDTAGDKATGPVSVSEEM